MEKKKDLGLIGMKMEKRDLKDIIKMENEMVFGLIYENLDHEKLL